MQYDQSVSTFSPDGKIFQVEYAQKAVETAGTSIGVRCSDGIIIGVEKLVTSKLLVEGSGNRIKAVDDHIGVVCVVCVSSCRGNAVTATRSFCEFGVCFLIAWGPVVGALSKCIRCFLTVPAVRHWPS